MRKWEKSLGCRNCKCTQGNEKDRLGEGWKVGQKRKTGVIEGNKLFLF